MAKIMIILKEKCLLEYYFGLQYPACASPPCTYSNTFKANRFQKTVTMCITCAKLKKRTLSEWSVEVHLFRVLFTTQHMRTTQNDAM